MTNKNQDPPHFRPMQWFAYGGIATIAFGIGRVNGFGIILIPPLNQDEIYIFFARIVLFVEFVILAIRWIIATHYELGMWIRELNNPPSKDTEWVSMLCLSIVLGLLVSFPHRIVYISAFMTVYSFLNYWTQWICNDRFSIALEKTRVSKKHVVYDKKMVLNAMERFWIKRPQLARITSMMFFSSIAFSLAFAGHFQQGIQRIKFQLCAYILLILNILVSEIIVYYWRYILDKEIKEAYKNKK